MAALDLWTVGDQQGKKPWIPTYECVPGTHVKLLSTPDKMPGPSWGIPALKTCPGAVTGEHTVCGGHAPDEAMSKTNGGCYAQKGRYASSTVQNAQNVRLEWVRECMDTKEGEAIFVDTMVAAIRRQTRKDPYFRIHDSGDFNHPVYVRMWAAVVRALPDVAFWAPTRTWHTNNGARPLNLVILAQMQSLARECSNITIRPSALYLEEDAPSVPGLAAGSGVKSTGWNCPASTQGNECGTCRSCWTEKGAADLLPLALADGRRAPGSAAPVTRTRLYGRAEDWPQSRPKRADRPTEGTCEPCLRSRAHTR